jgi:hypothetical protein
VCRLGDGDGGTGAYGLGLADDGGDGLGGISEDGRGVHPIQVDVRRHVQARHPRSLMILARSSPPPFAVGVDEVMISSSSALDHCNVCD